MEKFNSEEYRQGAVENLNQLPKEERKGKLNETKGDSNYWEARQKTIEKRQLSEEEIDNGLGVLIKNKNLYHGSATTMIDSFNGAEEYTMGRGVYLTFEADKAIGYARVRVNSERNKETKPVIYEARVSNIKLIDLRKPENVKKVATDLRKKLLDKLPEINNSKYIPYYYGYGYLQAIEMIDKGVYGNGRIEAVAKYPLITEAFEEYVKSLGYDGVVGTEGGEGSNDLVIGDHSSYVIFDPQKVKILQEHSLV